MREPLDVAAVRAQVARPDGWWRTVVVVAETGSTNADLVAAAADRDVAGEVLVAEHQTGGRGRLGRSWVAPARSGLTFSVAVHPSRPPATLGWLPLLTGTAVAEGVAAAGVEARLKWPNDVLAGGRKLAGVLAERVGVLVVVGVGLNVSLAEAELPVPEATSMLLAGAAPLDRSDLLAVLLGRLAAAVRQWDTGAADADVRAAYLARSDTVGRDVMVELPGGDRLAGRAVDVDPQGRLVVDGPAGLTAVAAGDVHHVR